MRLSEVASDLFLFLVTFRRQVRKGLVPDPSSVRNQLLDIFERQQSMVRDDPKLEKLYDKARYALVVTADEILINSNWAYAQQWEDEILEYEFFKTRIAGEKFFELIEDLGDEEEELAEIYYLCLSLGFVGRYKDDSEELRRLKRRLYRMVPGRITDDERRVTPDAYFVAEGSPDIQKPLVNLTRIALVCATLLIVLWVGYFVYKGNVTGQIAVYADEMRAMAHPDNMKIRQTGSDEPIRGRSGDFFGDTPVEEQAEEEAEATPSPTPEPRDDFFSEPEPALPDTDAAPGGDLGDQMPDTELEGLEPPSAEEMEGAAGEAAGDSEAAPEEAADDFFN